MSIRVLTPGALTTIQDSGRFGFQKFGFQENGACDKFSYQIANLIVGNRQSKPLPALEMTFSGGSFLFESPQIICLTGADMKPVLNDQEVPRYVPVPVKAGDILTFHTAVLGLRGYLAVYGGFDVPSVMNSGSTSLKCSLGGFMGRALQKGDQLQCVASEKEVEKKVKSCQVWSNADRQRKNGSPLLLKSSGVRVMDGRSYPIIRVVAGPQEEAFTEKGIQTFSQSIYRVSGQSDRMAYRMEGDLIESVSGSDIISDGIVEGSIQVSSDGQPIVMMADHQTTGGYAKIGTVISADLPRLAQMKPGDQLGFRFVTVYEAAQAAKDMNQVLKELERLQMDQ